MMTRMNRWWLFFYTFVLTEIILLLTLYSYFYSQSKKGWLKELFTAKISHIPLFIYILVIALVVSLMVTLVVYFFRRSQYSNLEEKLALLARNHYDSPLFLKRTQTLAQPDGMEEIDSYIDDIRKKMATMSKDLQVISSQPQMVDGESKELILQAERHRIARELHDSVSQQLFAASMMMATLLEEAKREETTDSLQKQVEMVGDIINHSQSEMRALLLHLRPISLEGKTLKKGIQQLLIELQTKVNIELTWEVEDISLESGMEDHLFRIVQELLSNTLRHAKATSLDVYLKRRDHVLLLRVIDDGVGFDTTDSHVGSYGLSNIRERVNGMGGTCKIISFKGKGTSIDIRVPIVEE